MVVKQTIIVSSTGEGYYTTIGEAIKNAQPDSCILVRSGLYQEGLIIDKQLEIIGDGLVADIVIESTDSSCIIMGTDYAVVRGLTLRGCREVRYEFYAVDIPQGRLVLEDCDITSNSLSCIGIHGATANPLIRRCQIHDGKADGVWVYENGQGTVEDCDIFANTYSGVRIRKGSNPIIRRCQIHDNGSTGVLFSENGQGTVEDCDIFANAKVGVAIREGANPIIRRCQIHDGKENGIIVSENGQGTVEDCDIFANVKAGVAIKQGGNPIIRRCQINRNGYEAVWVYENGAGRVENCNLTGNTRGAWDIETGCSVYRSGNIED
ncbi:MAG TPA: right-handed parallel beta-helix repeat-containing protein [Oculatellaceae cyanobacterium]|jgi:parallel beta-helix repeat protein